MKKNWIERFTGLTLAFNPAINIIGLILLSFKGKGLIAKIKADRSMLVIWFLMAISGIITVFVAPDKIAALEGFLIPFVIVWLYILGRWVIKDPEKFVRDSIRGAAILSLIVIVAKLFQWEWSIGNFHILSHFVNNGRAEVLYVADNLLALLVQVGIVGAFGGLFVYWKEKKYLVENVIALALNIGALLVTESRGGMLGTLAGVLFLVICYGVLAIISAGLLTGALFVFSSRLRFLFMPRSAGNNEWVRVEIWRATLKMIKDHLFFGIGAGQFVKEIQPYRPESLMASEYDTVITCSHSNYLSFIAGWGIIGGILFFGWQLWALIRAFIKGLTPLQKIIVAILISFFAHVLINDLVVAYWGIFLGLVENPYFQSQNSSVQPE